MNVSMSWCRDESVAYQNVTESIRRDSIGVNEVHKAKLHWYDAHSLFVKKVRTRT